MVSQQIIQDQQTTDLNPEDEEMSELPEEEKTPGLKNFDPDEDGFEFGFEQASALHKNINILQYIRKVLMPNNFRQFDSQVDQLQELFNRERLEEEVKDEQELPTTRMATNVLLPVGWQCAKHDRALLLAAGQKGFDGIAEHIQDLDGFEVKSELAIRRIEEVCDYYKDQ